MELYNECLLQQLLTQDHKTSLEDLFQQALTFEAAEQESLKCAESGTAANSVNAFNQGSRKLRSTIKGQRSTNKSTDPRTCPPRQATQPGSCNSCGENHACSTCHFCNAKCLKCGKVGHIQRVCKSTPLAVVYSNTSTQSLNSSQQSAAAGYSQQPIASSAVVALSHSSKDIPPIFQILQLPELGRRLHLMVDSASTVTFINVATRDDLDQPPMTPANRGLSGFEGQQIKPLGYFQTLVKCEHSPSQSAVMSIFVSWNGVNIIGRDSQKHFNIVIDPQQFGVVSSVSIPDKCLQLRYS